MRFNGPEDRHKERYLISFWWWCDGYVMEIKKTTKGQRWQKKLAQNPLSEPFNRFICIVFIPKLILSPIMPRTKAKSRGNASSSASLFPNQLSRDCAEKTLQSLIRWISLRKKRIFNCPDGNSGFSKLFLYLISDEFHYQTIDDEVRRNVHCSLFVPNEETFLRRSYE